MSGMTLHIVHRMVEAQDSVGDTRSGLCLEFVGKTKSARLSPAGTRLMPPDSCFGRCARPELWN